MAAAAVAAVVVGTAPSYAQTCNDGAGPVQVLPVTCTGTFGDQIFFTILGLQNFTAFTSNLDPDDAYNELSDPALELYDDVPNLIAMDDDGAGDYQVANAGTPFSAFIVDTTYTAVGVDALLQNIPLDGGAGGATYELDVLGFGESQDYRVHLFSFSISAE